MSQSDLIVTSSVESIKQLSMATFIENWIKVLLEGPVNLHLKKTAKATLHAKYCKEELMEEKIGDTAGFGRDRVHFFPQ